VSTMRSTTLLLFTLVVCLGSSYGSEDEETSKPASNVPTAVEETVAAVDKVAKPRSLRGWLTAPTQAPRKINLESREGSLPLKKAKPGFCGSPKTYGIKCMMRLDQCKEDHQCPGVSKCCMVGVCGYLCVKPKPTEELVKEDVKPEIKKKDKKESTTTEAYDDNNESLKASDIIDMKDMKDKKDFIVAEEKPPKIEDDTAINEMDSQDV